MRCSYCGSDDIIISSGEYVCRKCGSVLGPVLYVPRIKYIQLERNKDIASKILLIQLNQKVIEKKYSYSEKILMYIKVLCRELDLPEEVFRSSIQVLKDINKVKIQGKNPKVIAATIVYLISNKFKLNINKEQIARRLGISKLTIRDTATQLRKLCKELNY